MSTRALDVGRGLHRSDVPTILLGAGAAALSALLVVVLGPVALAVPVVAGIVVLLARYPIVLFVVFLHIGLYKDLAIVKAFPVDATVALALLLAFVCAERVLSGRATRPPLMFALPVLVIAIMLALSLFWTPVPDYGLEKTLRFVTLTAIGAAAPFCLLETRKDFMRLLWTIAGCALVGGMLVLGFGSTAGVDRLEFGGAANTIFTSRFLLSGAFILILAPMLGVFRSHRLLLVMLGLGLVATAASIGSRGPVVGLALALACTIAVAVLRQPRRVLPVIAVAAAGLVFLPFITLPTTSAERLSTFAQNPVAALEADGRSRLYGKAVELSNEHPLLGFGAGGFFLFSYVLTDREERYPHNIFLEASSEIGLIPALLLAASVGLMLVGAYRRALVTGSDADRNLIYVVAGVFLLNFFAAQFSGDFNDNRTFWALLGVGWLIAARGIPSDEPGPKGQRVATR